MAVMKHSIKLLVILIGLLAIKETMGTSCIFEHPQTAVCRASFVIKGKVLDNNWQPSAQKDKALHSFFRLRYIKVQLRRIFKGAKSVNAEKDSTIFIRFASFDLPTLEVGHLYVLSGYSFGTSLFMNSCSWSAKWNELTTGQQFGINRNFYWNYCGCNIIDCQSASCLKDRSSCKWNSQNTEVAGFLVKGGICTLTEGGLCKWQNFSL